jgi:hypothetical protein
VSTFVFSDRWLLAADPTRVWAVVRAVEDWPTWWPSVRSVAPVPAAPGGGPTWRFTFGTRLPYTMVFDAEVLRDDPMVGVETRVSGRVEGHGSWAVQPVEGGSEVRFDWSVRPTLRWMRLLSPVARRVFAWNHEALMVEGGAALAEELGRPLLAPVVSELRAGPPG